MATFSIDIGMAVTVAEVNDSESTERWIHLVQEAVEAALVGLNINPIEDHPVKVEQVEVFDTRRND